MKLSDGKWLPPREKGMKLLSALLGMLATVAAPGILAERQMPRAFSLSVLAFFCWLGFALTIHLALTRCDRRTLVISGCLGLVYSLFLMLGRALYMDHVLSYRLGAILLGFWKTLCFAPVPGAAAALALRIFQGLGAAPTLWDRKGGLRYFITAWVAIFVCWLPALLAFYPGLFNYDAITQASQAFGLEQLTDHHPLLHTFLMWLCFRIGLLFDSAALGELLYSVGQMAALSAAFAYGCWFVMDQFSLPKWLAVALPALFALNPLHALLSISFTKDVLFGAISVVVLVRLIELTRMEALPRSPLYWGGLLLELVVFCALRSTASYTLLLLAVLAVIFLGRGKRRAALALVAAAVLFTGGNMAAKKLLNAGSVEIKEALVIPMQQVARVVKYHKEELPKEDLDLIYKVVPEEDVENYSPHLADWIKYRFSSHEFIVNRGAFGELYLRYLTQYPGDYVDSVLESTLGFWYPGVHNGQVDDWSKPGRWNPPSYQYLVADIAPELYSDVINVVNLDSRAPALQKLYDDFARLCTQEDIPLLSHIASTALPLWLTLFIFAAVLLLRKWELLLPCLFLLCIWVMLIPSPIVLARYTYPIFCGAPLLAAALAPERWKRENFSLGPEKNS